MSARRKQPLREVNVRQTPQYVIDGPDAEDETGNKKARARRSLRRKNASSPAWTMDSSSSSDDEGEDASELEPCETRKPASKSAVNQTLHSNADKCSAGQGAVCGTGPPLPDGCSFREALSRLPTTRDGLIAQCELIATRAESIKLRYGMCVNPCMGLYTSLELKELIKESGKCGKVGLDLPLPVLDTLDEVMEYEDLSGQPRGPWRNLEDLARLQKPGVDLEVDSQVDYAYLKSEKEFLDRVLKADPVDMLIVEAEDPVSFGFLGVMAVYDAGCLVDMSIFIGKVRCVSFDPSFGSCLVHLPLSDCRISVFYNGKMIVTGANSIKTSLIATRNVLELLQRCGFEPLISKRRFHVRNMTAMIDVGRQIDITGFAEKHPDRAFMDCEIFGAVSFLADKSAEYIHRGKMGLTFQIFSTGRIVMVGGKTEKHLIRTFRLDLFPLLKPFLNSRRPDVTMEETM